MSRRRDIRRRVVNNVSKVFIVLHRFGVRTGRAQVLKTVGRQSGQPRRTPVGVVPKDGQRYIFQAYPRSAWVANVRAQPDVELSTGRRSQLVRLIEVDVEQRRMLLLRQLSAEPDTGALLVRSGLVTDAAPSSVAAAAPRIAVFRVESR